jgi:hypothetical protein
MTPVWTTGCPELEGEGRVGRRGSERNGVPFGKEAVRVLELEGFGGSGRVETPPLLIDIIS